MGKGKRRPKRTNANRPKRKSRSKRVQDALPMAFATGVRVLRTLEVFSRIDSTWLDKLSRWGITALKIFFKELLSDGLTTEALPVGALQAFHLKVDDLIVTSMFSRKTANDNLFNLNFQKAKIKSIHIRVRPTAPVAKRCGRIAMVFVPLSEAESLELAGETKEHYVTQTITSFDDLLIMPGMKTAPASTGLSFSWVPPPQSWMRDYVRVGRSLAKGSSANAWGLPFAILYVAFKDYANGKADETELYGVNTSLFEIDIGASLDLAEWGDCEVQYKLESLYDPLTAGLTRLDGSHTDVDLSCVRKLGMVSEIDISPTAASRGSMHDLVTASRRSSYASDLVAALQSTSVASP